jgi:O-antigen/teichoic acid export membrane protein
VKIVKSFSVYTLTLFFNAAVSFITFSLITHFFTREDLGVINLYNSLTALLVPFIGVGIQFTLTVDYFRMEQERYAVHFTNALAVPFLISVLLTVVIALVYPFTSDFFEVSLFFAAVLPLTCLLTVFNEVMLGLIRNKEKHFLFARFSVFRNLLEILLTVLLVAAIGMAWQGRLSSALIALVAGGAGMYYLVRRWHLFSGSFSAKEMKKVLIAGLPFIPERLSIFVLTYSDRFFIDHYHDIDDVGVYGSGAQIALIVNIAIISLVNTFHPYIFRNLKEMNRGLIKKAILAFIGVSAFITLAVILAVPLCFKWFIGEQFSAGQVYARYLSAGFFFWSIYAVMLAFLLYFKKHRVIMTIALIGMACSLALNTYNVKEFGPIGAAYTGIITYFLMALMATIQVYFMYKRKEIFNTEHGEEKNGNA